MYIQCISSVILYCNAAMHPLLFESLFIQTHKSLQFFMNFITIYKMVDILLCDLYFKHLYVTCFLHTNSIHGSANARSTEKV